MSGRKEDLWSVLPWMLANSRIPLSDVVQYCLIKRKLYNLHKIDPCIRITLLQELNLSFFLIFFSKTSSLKTEQKIWTKTLQTVHFHRTIDVNSICLICKGHSEPNFTQSRKTSRKNNLSLMDFLCIK